MINALKSYMLICDKAFYTHKKGSLFQDFKKFTGKATLQFYYLAGLSGRDGAIEDLKVKIFYINLVYQI